ncbi:hypothetical protein E2C01_005393 [Portunus trituberculatus]|uniref:Uncharacterized protein n=1 Tax=Portunus trituberculatus TaxID=210409 RepID=A0A5B7CUA8_PORTR|nr:hypothetical protein [Portunus trituberculatus]
MHRQVFSLHLVEGGALTAGPPPLPQACGRQLTPTSLPPASPPSTKYKEYPAQCLLYTNDNPRCYVQPVTAPPPSLPPPTTHTLTLSAATREPDTVWPRHTAHKELGSGSSGVSCRSRPDTRWTGRQAHPREAAPQCPRHRTSWRHRQTSEQ